ncbi:sporulation histidine kinase inhibitor Sda [Jeotgalibacillus sp. R-1-5s-1]|nr:sporulation histidine kinase inhibitor Sda [Jeotgalibacillus sp. R-1-5s-1]
MMIKKGKIGNTHNMQSYLKRWNRVNSLNQLTDTKLIEAFKAAKERNLSSDFILLLENEMIERNIRYHIEV